MGYSIADANGCGGPEAEAAFCADRRPEIVETDGTDAPALRSIVRASLVNFEQSEDSGGIHAMYRRGPGGDPDAQRRVEHWREVPIPPELVRDLKMVHRLREESHRRLKEPLAPVQGPRRTASS